MNAERIVLNDPGSRGARHHDTQPPHRPGAICALVRTDTDIATVRREGRALARLLGFSSAEATMLATVISELSRNMLRDASHGVVIVAALDDAGRRGVAVMAQDGGHNGAGPAGHLFEVDTALSRLEGVRRAMDDFEVVSEPGQWTTVTVKKWMR